MLPLVLHIELSLGGLINPIARLVGLEPNPNDRVACSERLNLATFEQIKFYKVDGGRIYWIYPGNWLMPFPSVDHTSPLNRANLYFLSSNEELAQPTPPPPPPHPKASSSS